jgi:hypothetical protein
MYGVIYLWRVKADRLAEHAEVMRATLAVERERAPEVLMNLTFGPAADGTCAEVQLYADAAASEAFGARVEREEAELKRIWSRFGDLCEPDGWRTVRFECMEFLSESFLREPALAACRVVPA